jgi:hypothetical protein
LSRFAMRHNCDRPISDWLAEKWLRRSRALITDDI